MHKHHPIIPIGAGLIQFVYDLRSRLAYGGYPSEKSISAIFRAVVWESLSESEQEQWSEKMGKSKDWVV